MKYESDLGISYNINSVNGDRVVSCTVQSAWYCRKAVALIRMNLITVLSTGTGPVPVESTVIKATGVTQFYLVPGSPGSARYLFKHTILSEKFWRELTKGSHPQRLSEAITLARCD
jgi:hypothetical protein